MKAKIFAKLKQEYSSLGLGDEILMSRAESLAALGLVTDENLDMVVASQRKDLENLQKANDKRVTDALEKERKKYDEAEKKRAEEAKAAAEAKEAEEKEKARLAAEAAEKERLEKQQTEEAQKKEAEEKKQLDELEKMKEQGVSDTVIAYLKEQITKASEVRKKAEEEAAKEKNELIARFEEFAKAQKEQNDSVVRSYTELKGQHDALKTDYDALRKESEDAKIAKAKAARQQFILSKAKELGVPQWRIDEGFMISDDATNDSIVEILTTVSNNIKTELLPSKQNLPIVGNHQPSAEDIAALAKTIVR